jgi:hypothetical protein
MATMNLSETTAAKLASRSFNAEGDDWWRVPPDLDVLLHCEDVRGDGGEVARLAGIAVEDVLAGRWPPAGGLSALRSDDLGTKESRTLNLPEGM